MIACLPLANFYNLAGPDLIVIFFVLAFWFGLIAGIVLLVRFLVRRKTDDRATNKPEQRLQQLESLRSSGSITDSEYQEQRRRILSQV
ncbi:MAG: hypothetical protein QOD99_2926 [Chthoniobacter sp.]|jgi:uncharacterized membrane protein|nr:hypothetical protein [Chthoniobacter sp.]